jgi:outer membrane receptor protein involved in Fe transport
MALWSLRRRLAARVCVALTFILPTASRAAAQSGSTASLGGQVLDSSLAAVPGAQVALTNRDRGWTRSEVSDKIGRFVFALLEPGDYQVVATLDGFRPYRLDQVALQVNDARSIRIVLTPGDVTEVVNVSGNVISTRDSPAVSMTMPQAYLDRLPVNGRTLQSLLLLTPGVNLSPNQVVGGSGQFSVNGQRANANTFIVDGVSANTGIPAAQVPGEGGSGTLPGFTAQGATSSLASVDAVQEFTVQTSTYSAEFGPSPGGQISLVTRSGTNAVHGSAFEYFRHDALDSRDYFAVRNNLPKPPERQHQFGGVLGGPVMLGRLYDGRNRTFFFFSQESLRLQQPTTANTTTISTAARANAPAAIRPIFNAYPLPTGPDGPNGFAPFAASFSVPSRSTATSLRMDHAFRQVVTVFGRYNHAPSSIQRRSATTATPSVVSATTFDTDIATFGATAVMSPRTILTMRGNVSRAEARNEQTIDGFGGAVAPSPDRLLPAVAGGTGFFNVNVIGTPGFGVGIDAQNRQQQRQITASLVHTRGAHTLKGGGDYRRLLSTLGSNEDSQYRATYNFANVATAANSVLALGLINVRETSQLNFNNFSAYAQDTWHPADRLTVDLGVRYELNPAPHGATLRDQPRAITSVDSPLAITLAPPGAPLFETRFSNVAPRAGAAWRVHSWRAGDMTVRGGYGMYFDLGYGVITNAAGAFPLLRTKRLASGTRFPLSATAAAPVPADAPPPYDLIRAFDPHILTPRTDQYSLTVDQQLGPGVEVSASYVGAKGRRLLRQESLTAPNRTIALLQLTTNGDRSRYNALQLQFSARGGSASARVNYTLSSSTDTSSSDASFLLPSQQFNPMLDEGPSDFDVRHALSAVMSWTAPAHSQSRWRRAVFGGWTVDGVFHARSATPFTISGVRFAGASFFTLRPDAVDGVSPYLTDPSAPGGVRMNPQAFRFDPVIRQGNVGRNAFRGFAFYQVDLAVGRRIPLRAGIGTELRLEVFNALNHVNLSNPSGSSASLGTVAAAGTFVPGPTFGVSTSTLPDSYRGLSSLYQVGGPRSVQLAVRLRF